MKRLNTRLANSAPKTRLDDFLFDWLPDVLGKSLSKTKIRSLILSGAVYVNRHRNKIPATIIYAGAVLEVYFDEKKIGLDDQVVSPQQNSIKNDHVIFEDEWLIIINKNAGIPTQPTIDPNRANLFDLTKQYLANREKKNFADVYLGMHHRLDRDTSGIVMFTKKESANKGVSELFLNHKIQKTYHCLVWLMPDSPKLNLQEKFEVKNFLAKVSPKNENARFGSVKSNGDFAHTFFRVLEVFKQGYWMEAQPKTGRTHQIRVHTSEMNLPIMGDPQYFPKNVLTMIKAPRLLLHAYQLEFLHPISSLPMKVEAPLPDDFLKILGILKA